MLKICLVFWKSEPQYAYKRYAYKKIHVHLEGCTFVLNCAKICTKAPYHIALKLP